MVPFLWVKEAIRDLLPIVAVITIFQLLVLQKPFPDLGNMLLGVLLLILGMTFFVRGLEMGLFPLGDTLAYALVRRGSLFWLLTFAFTMGFSTTIVEPALISISNKAAEVAAQAQLIGQTPDEQIGYARMLRIVVAISVGTALLFGALRIVRGWPIHHLIIGGYLLIVLITPFAPQAIIGIAYDSGGVTTSTVTVPLTAALGVGLANTIRGRNPLIDGFGLIAFASLTPIAFVMIYGILLFGWRG
ncbi:MAG: DUF1538 domain-containing protein [Magnetococcales bacterium]|nr:DUF1538 domain-containing protein [Magnetococcales bacterium]